MDFPFARFTTLGTTEGKGLDSDFAKKRRQQEGANELCADHRGPQTLQKRFDPRENRGRVQMCRSGENEDRGLN